MKWIRKARKWLFDVPDNPIEIYRKQKLILVISSVLIAIACVEIIISLTISAARLKAIWTILHR